MINDIQARRVACLFFGFLFFYFSPSSASDFATISVNGHIIKVEIVSTSASQNLGLGDRNALPKGSGMLFLYKTAGEKIFWMKRMRFAIDIIWILQGSIVHIEKNVPPPSIIHSPSRLPTYGHGIVADMVLEVSKGFADKAGLQLGDSILFWP